MAQTVGAFVFPFTWQAWSAAEADRMLRAYMDFGVNTLVTESETYRDDLIELAHRLGMQFIGGISCFSEHAANHAILRQRPELHPLLEDGTPRPPMEWYVGVTPTFADYNAARLDVIDRVMRAHDLDGIVLDFIRWPLHWELELRPEAPRLLESSFDPHTVSLFLAYANLELPSPGMTGPEQSAWIVQNHREAWTDFKCHIITDFVAQARERIRSHRGGGASFGVYLVPETDARRAQLVGQRVTSLAPHVDFFAPMLYHAIVHQPPEWVGRILDDVTQLAPGKVLPVLQVDSAEGAELGADWGAPMSADEWRQIASATLKRGDVQGIVAFTGTSLFRDGRGAMLKASLQRF